MHVSLGGEKGILTVRTAALGLVYTGPCLIYWITVDPSAAAWAIELSDGTAAGTTKWSTSDALAAGQTIPFPKPMEMATGIYAEVVTNLTATIGYAVLPS